MVFKDPKDFTKKASIIFNIIFLGGNYQYELSNTVKFKEHAYGQFPNVPYTVCTKPTDFEILYFRVC